MPNDRELSDLSDPSSVNSPARGNQAGSPADVPVPPPDRPADPNDEIPVPIMMSAAEIDERAQVVETLRDEEGIQPPESERAEPGSGLGDQPQAAG